MVTSNCDNAINYKSTDSQKECCAVIAMREAVETLAAREKISYEEALLRFTSSRAYEALFDFDTEIWKEGSDYLLSLYDYCTSKKTAEKIITRRWFYERGCHRRSVISLLLV